MKKKLEAELISIAHRILKLKNRSELNQLQQETLKLYEKISVLKFVEDNFADIKPTIGYASAEEKLEEIYGIEEVAPVQANEEEAKEEAAKAEKEAKGKKQKQQDIENDKGEGVTAGSSPEEVVSEEEKEETKEADAETEATTTEVEAEPETVTEEPQAEGEAEQQDAETEQEDDQPEVPAEEETEEPETTIPQPVTEEDIKVMEESAAAVFEKEEDSTPQEEEKAVDAEVITIEPDKDAGTDEIKLDFGFAFERTIEAEETKQKEITFEDYADYKEPEFVKKEEEPKAAPRAEEQAATEAEVKNEEAETPVRDWRDWEPSTSPYGSKTEVKEEPVVNEQPAASVTPEPVTRNIESSHLKTITLGLNDRIAFEKNLFGGSGEDLNRVISQLNTMDRFEDAQDFINDLVKPDYNNWQGKEEYEERLMQLVEQRFS